MKKFLRLAWGADSTPLGLLGSVILSFLVMLYINTFIGGFGGIPAFVAYTVVFFLIRSVQISRNRISHFVAISSGTELRYIYVSYAEGYICFYIIMKVVQIFAGIAGWGNMKGVTVGEYLNGLYGTTIMERWAYIFAFVFMLAFVLSLFPLLVIRRIRTWVCYAICDVLFHTAVIAVLFLTSRHYISASKMKKVSCLLDALLLSNLRSTGRVAFYLFLIGVYVIIAVLGSYYIAKRIYRPKPGHEVKNPQLYQPLSAQEIDELRMKARKRWCIYGGISFVIILICVLFFVYVFFIQPDKNIKYEQVGECLTEDRDFGPIEYKGSVYIPVDVSLNLDQTGTAVGYLAMKGENTKSRYYRLVNANVLYEPEDPANLYIEVSGTVNHDYLPVTYLEEQNLWRRDEIFLLWDEDWSGESLYSKEVTGYSVCPQELINGLEEEFGVVSYNINDFEDYDAYFTLSGYTDMQDAFAEGAYAGDWAGCILVRDERFYYCNYENEVTGELLEILKAVLGGAQSE